MDTVTTSNNIKYEILEEEEEDADTSEEGSEIIIITPIHNDPEDDDVDTSVVNIVLSTESNNNNNPITSDPNPHSSTTAEHLYLTNNNNDDNITSCSSISMPALSCISPALPPPPYEGTEASAAANGTTTLLNFTEDSTEDQNFIRLLMVSYYPGISSSTSSSNPKISSRNGANNAVGGHGLPSYDVATDLPSYEEAERTKEEEMRLAEQQQTDLQEDEERNTVDTTEHLTSMAIGTDWTFLYTFIISFLFNWIGFLLSLCITSTVSGRCGALSGLGLSVVKWVAIVRHSNWASGFAEEESWLWWSLMICGFLLFIRGCVQYIHIKYEWKKIAARIQQFYFF